MADERSFFSPYTQPTPYWIVLEGSGAGLFGKLGAQVLHRHAELFGKAVGDDWTKAWSELSAELFPLPAGSTLRAAIIAAGNTPELQEIELSLRPASEVDAVARHLWFARYLEEGRLICFMQRVIDRRGKQVGHEAFARMEAPDGGIVGGGAIMQAAQVLHLEYQVDRLMHKNAIECFIAGDLEGYLFINFLTGFIHRPEVYLEGLRLAVERHHVLPRTIALDVPLVDYAKDTAKLKSIAAYCRSRGFALSLDDVMSPDGLADLLRDIKPAFVKLDAKLAASMQDEKRRGGILEIIRLAHGAGAMVLAEGVETEALHQAYLAAEVDMFQGYLFGAPERCPPLQKDKKAS